MLKLMHHSPLTPMHHSSSQQPTPSLLSSAVATVVNRHQISAMFPLHQLVQHNYIIKTCLTTFTYLTTVVQNKRSAISTFETIVSVVTTESLTNLYATDLMPDIKPTKVRICFNPGWLYSPRKVNSLSMILVKAPTLLAMLEHENPIITYLLYLHTLTHPHLPQPHNIRHTF